MKRRSARRGVRARSRGKGAGSAALPLALVLALLRPAARADDFVAYKYEYYDEAGGRVGVRTQGLTASEDLGTNMQLGLTLMNDAIAGASPTGIPAPAGSNQVPLAELSDHRKEWEVDFSRKIGDVDITVGTSQSREHDYVSRGWSLNTVTDLNERNTKLLLGVAGHSDDVETFFDPQHFYLGKQALSAIAGFTQVLGPRTFVTLNLTWSRETGYLDDQYKLVQKTEELVAGSFFPLPFAENRPGERNMGSVFAGLNRAYPGAHGALEASYRFYADTFGIEANSVELRWIQKLGDAFSLSPEVRLYRQGAADFYYYDLDATAITPTVVPNSNGPAYSSDYRLSSFDALTYGLKATWKVRTHFQVELAFDRYAMHGLDAVTPRSAYPVANIMSVGARVSW
jgi:uncharacterized protein DUF3570